MNAIRQKFVQHFNLEDFEFSQQFLYFWDRVERAYFFINTYEQLARKGEAPDGRLMMFLLSNPLNDGGQWDMLINLVEKYGLVPKAVWPEAFTSGRSMRLRKIMNYKVHINYVYCTCYVCNLCTDSRPHFLPNCTCMLKFSDFIISGCILFKAFFQVGP